MLLIADSGSTKTHWVLLDNNNRSDYQTIGYNPYFIGTSGIYESIAENLIPQLNPDFISEIFFYGAGCSTPEKTSIVHSALTKAFPKAEIFVSHDLLAAARALLSDKRGFTAILGTGSNTCIYDGKEIEKNIDSLGYLLGDEGSGCYIGKKIVGNFMRDYLPVDLKKKFDQKYNITAAEIYDRMYNKPLPNRFLAGFAAFADENKDHSYIRNIVKESFHDFFKNLVTQYPGYVDLSFNCIGSVGFVFQDVLKEVAESYNMKTGQIMRSPIEGLINFHVK